MQTSDNLSPASKTAISGHPEHPIRPSASSNEIRMLSEQDLSSQAIENSDISARQNVDSNNEDAAEDNADAEDEDEYDPEIDELETQYFEGLYVDDLQENLDWSEETEALEENIEANKKLGFEVKIQSTPKKVNISGRQAR